MTPNETTEGIFLTNRCIFAATKKAVKLEQKYNYLNNLFLAL